MGTRYSEFDIVKEPQLPKRFRMWKHQWVGIPVLLAIPILALTGFFGDSFETSVSGRADLLELHAKFPTKARYGFEDEIRLEVRNKSGRTLPKVEVLLDPEYLAQFSEVYIHPSTERPYQLVLRDVGPGESRKITVEYRGKSYGAHSGKFKALVDGTEVAVAEIGSYTFP
jgi:hypothetical protein